MRILILALILLSFINPVLAQSRKCSYDDEAAADNEASNLRDWNSIYRSFKRFAQCDDGAISEGYSISIVYLLTDNWNSLDKLNALISKDKKFDKFVIEHVDVLMTREQASRIYANVRSQCPVSLKKLCKRIENRLDETDKGR